MARAAKTAKGLTEKQERFAVAYLQSGNASAAYRLCYGAEGMKEATVNKRAAELLKHGGITGRLTELRDRVSNKAVLSVEKTLAQLARIVNGDPREFFDAGGKLRPLDTLSDDAVAALASIKSFEEYQGRGENREAIGMVREVKFFNRVDAIEKAMKHLGLFERDNKQKADPIAAFIQWVRDNNAASGTHGLPVRA